VIDAKAYRRPATVGLVGLVGGMGWESTLDYYRIINLAVREALGGAHSASCLIYSFDFAELSRLVAERRWEALTQAMLDACTTLVEAGAELLALCSVTGASRRRCDRGGLSRTAGADHRPYCCGDACCRCPPPRRARHGSDL